MKSFVIGRVGNLGSHRRVDFVGKEREGGGFVWVWGKFSCTILELPRTKEGECGLVVIELGSLGRDLTS